MKSTGHTRSGIAFRLGDVDRKRRQRRGLLAIRLHLETGRCVQLVRLPQETPSPAAIMLLSLQVHQGGNSANEELRPAAVLVVPSMLRAEAEKNAGLGRRDLTRRD